MRLTYLVLLGSALAARPFLSEPDTGIEDVLGDTPNGTLANLTQLVGLPDFQWAARRYLPPANYTYYINGVAGEWSARNNLEVYYRYTWRPRQLVDITRIPDTLQTTFLGYNFSVPFYISPCAKAFDGNKDGELGLVKGAAKNDVLYISSSYSSLTVEEIFGAAEQNQTMFRQIYLNGNITYDEALIRRVEKAGAKALIWTVDSNAGSNRQRADRYGVGSQSLFSDKAQLFTWDYYEKLRSLTQLPIALKGIQSVQTIREAAEHKVPAVIVSNHGGRSLDGAPSPLEVLLEIHEESPELVNQIDIWADGGVRYGGDILKLLALGAKGVGIGRPFMFGNMYGTDGVDRVIQILKKELITDAGNVGIPTLQDISPDYVSAVTYPLTPAPPPAQLLVQLVSK
ncbi:hydroxyacid oxidase [Trichosporon asahii var. asahii CBS 8904]|uniref:Hydroxyacid oxidase n=1 Tax=Trichosporon asahii var. asahii (strain CBS 8904) TaxID=1220162 RepID=K1VPS4_TRIAC|nr:hydroxyacid oxidase [Trichosporon asahii var. asahii CBS 8904]